jgi:hypothetical protein
LHSSFPYFFSICIYSGTHFSLVGVHFGFHSCQHILSFGQQAFDQLFHVHFRRIVL